MRLVALVLAAVASLASTSARHTETLYVRPLPSHKTLAHFHFATHEPRDAALLSPPALRQILTKYDAATLHLSFSVGLFDHGRYGPPDGASPATANALHAPFGARLQVTFRGDEASKGPLDDRWKGVTSELGGIFSASLNQMDETTIATAAAGARVAEFGGAAIEINATATRSSYVFYQATLAREELCTENLTPWLKMLPCRAHAGLGMLLDPIRILSGEYAMLSISAARDASGGWHFDQHVTTIQPTGLSLAELLLDGPDSDVALVSACPLASESSITIEQHDRPIIIDLTTFDTPLSTTQTVLPETDETASSPVSAHDAVSVHRFQTGYGQVHGGLAVRLENRDPLCSMRVTYNDISPWYLRLYFHTFNSRLTSLDAVDGSSPDTTLANEPTFAFVPAELRGRPNQFRVHVDLPPRSALVLSVQFDKVFVRLSEHPPDANRGFDIPSGVATFTPVDGGNCHVPSSFSSPRVVYSEPLLVALPTPDFSMPYNVITLTSTVVAFFAGSMLNTLLRKAPRIQRILASSTPSK